MLKQVMLLGVLNADRIQGENEKLIKDLAGQRRKGRWLKKVMNHCQMVMMMNHRIKVKNFVVGVAIGFVVVVVILTSQMKTIQIDF